MSEILPVYLLRDCLFCRSHLELQLATRLRYIHVECQNSEDGISLVLTNLEKFSNVSQNR